MRFYMIPSIVSVPLWIRVSRRSGKKRLWLAAMVVTGLSFGAMFFFGEGDVFGICFFAALAGFSAGAGGTIALFRDDDLAQPDPVRVRIRPIRIMPVVVLLAMQHHHDVCILFDRT